MIGAANLQSATSATIAGEYNVLLSPGAVHVFSGNGSASSPTVRSTVINGVGPFTYLWTITGNKISMRTTTDSDVVFTSGGFNESHNAVATLTVTDTGNLDEETNITIDVSFDFEVEGA